MLQGVSYLLAKLDPGKKDLWSRPIRETMTTWLRGQDNITYTPKVVVMPAHITHLSGASNSIQQELHCTEGGCHKLAV